jgi:hypothetical protein
MRLLGQQPGEGRRARRNVTRINEARYGYRRVSGLLREYITADALIEPEFAREAMQGFQLTQNGRRVLLKTAGSLGRSGDFTQSGPAPPWPAYPE